MPDWHEILRLGEEFSGKVAATPARKVAKLRKAFAQQLQTAHPQAAELIRVLKKGRLSFGALLVRARAEVAFACKRWTRQRAVSWVAYRNPLDMDRPTSHALLYDDVGKRLVDRDAERSFTEAIAKGLITEFKGPGGDVWYESEQVRTVFSETAGSAPIREAVGERRPARMSEANARDRLPRFIDEFHAKALKEGRSFSQDEAHKEAEKRFEKRIDRKVVRDICREKGFVGEVGRPRKIPRKS